MMSTSLDVQSRLEFARAAVAALRTLQIKNTEMTYGEFAKAIGLLSDDDHWKAWHRQQVRDILNLVAATQRKSGPKVKIKALDFNRVVNAKDRKPGRGLYDSTTLITKKRSEHS
jgi:hypothetical protein